MIIVTIVCLIGFISILLPFLFPISEVVGILSPQDSPPGMVGSPDRSQSGAGGLLWGQVGHVKFPIHWVQSRPASRALLVLNVCMSPRVYVHCHLKIVSSD